MAKNKTLYLKQEGDIHPLTNTGQVLSPDGENLEHRLNRLTDAVQGKGESASAHVWPMRYLGTYADMTQLNTALNEIFHGTDPHWQGTLRAHMAGQVVMIYQYALNFSIGDWAQVVTGMVAPSQDGTMLVRSNTPGIFWRSRETQGESVVRHHWQPLTTLALKTINGQSLFGSGNIEIGGGSGESIAVDDVYDPSSTNPISGRGVADALGQISTDVEISGGVVMVTYWGTQPPTSGMVEGEYCLDQNGQYYVLYRYNGLEWEDKGEPDTKTLYVYTENGCIYRFDGSVFELLSGEEYMKVINAASTHQTCPSSRAVWDLVQKQLGARAAIICVGWGDLADSGYDEGDFAMQTTLSQGGIGFVYKIVRWHENAWEEYGENGAPDKNTLYVDKANRMLWRWTGSYFESVGVDVTDEIVSGTDNDGQVPTSGAVKSYVGGQIASATTGLATEGYVDAAIANLDPEQDGSKGWGVANYGDPYFPEYYLQVTYDNTTYNLGELYAYEEGTPQREAANNFIDGIVWGKDYYNWPVRCYNGVVENITVNTSKTAAKDIEVFAPSERIYEKGGRHAGIGIEYTTSDVYLNRTLVNGVPANYFVLKVGNTYYKYWKNSNEWNNIQNGFARIDCVFSNIEVVNPTNGQALRQSSLVHYSGGQYTFYDIVTCLDPFDDIGEPEPVVTPMTSFTVAVHDCLVSTVNGKTKGSMRLSDRIYYLPNYNYDTEKDVMTDVTDYGDLDNNTGTRQGFLDASGFVVDGGKGVLFIRSHRNAVPILHNQSPSIAFSMQGSHDGIIRNLTMRAIRDRDNGVAASSCPPLSSSESCLDAFSLGRGANNTMATNILFKNIDLQGFDHDFDCSTSDGVFVIDGWKSREMSQTVMKGTWHIKNADVTERICVGTGMHIVYGQGAKGLNMLVENSRFVQPDQYGSAMWTTHGSEKASTMTFVNCIFEGGWLFHANTSNSSIRDTWTFKGCEIRRVYEYAVLNGGYAALNYMTTGSLSNFLFDECHIEVKSGSIIGNGTTVNAPSQTISFRGCEIYTENPSSGSFIVKINTGKFTTENCVTNFLNNKGWAKYSASKLLQASIDAAEARGIAENLDDVVNGSEDISEYTPLQHYADLYQPDAINASVGTGYYIEEENLLATCETAGVKTNTTLVFYLRKKAAGSTYSEQTISGNIKLNDNEVYTISITIDSNTECVDDGADENYPNRFASLVKACLDAALIHAEIKEVKFISSGNVLIVYARVTAGNCGRGADILDPKQKKTSVVIAGSQEADCYVTHYKDDNSTNYKYIEGKDPVWLERQADGLSQTVSTLCKDVREQKTSLEAVEKMTTTSGEYTSRPADAPVGYCYFDTGAEKPIWVKERTVSGGTVTLTWVYADGTPVTNS